MRRRSGPVRAATISATVHAAYHRKKCGDTYLGSKGVHEYRKPFASAASAAHTAAYSVIAALHDSTITPHKTHIAPWQLLETCTHDLTAHGLVE